MNISQILVKTDESRLKVLTLIHLECVICTANLAAVNHYANLRFAVENKPIKMKRMPTLSEITTLKAHRSSPVTYQGQKGRWFYPVKGAVAGQWPETVTGQTVRWLGGRVRQWRHGRCVGLWRERLPWRASLGMRRIVNATA